MSLILAAILLIGQLLAVVAVVIGLPLFFGMMAYDVMQTRGAISSQPSDTRVRIAIERGFARAFVVAGGAFWSVASFAGLYSFRETGMGYALIAAFVPLVACLATLIVGWYYERIVSVLLAAASLAVIVWGVIYQFELGVWILMTIALIGPMMTASTLFWLARRDQEAFELETSLAPELAPVFAARSSIS